MILVAYLAHTPGLTMCKCIAAVNKELAKSNTRLDELTMVNFKTGKGRQSLHVATTKITRKPGKAKMMLVTFCPFCGKRSAPAPSPARQE